MTGTDALTGQTISHYRVIEKLGGGMGVVLLQLKRFRDRGFLSQHGTLDCSAGASKKAFVSLK